MIRFSCFSVTPEERSCNTHNIYLGTHRIKPKGGATGQSRNISDKWGKHLILKAEHLGRFICVDDTQHYI